MIKLYLVFRRSGWCRIDTGGCSSLATTPNISPVPEHCKRLSEKISKKFFRNILRLKDLTRTYTRGGKGSDYGGFRTPYPQKIFSPRRGVSFKRTEAGFTSRDNICAAVGVPSVSAFRADIIFCGEHRPDRQDRGKGSRFAGSGRAQGAGLRSGSGRRRFDFRKNLTSPEAAVYYHHQQNRGG